MYANFGTRGVIRLLNDSNLETALWRYGARKVANECKYVYSTIHHQSINITTASLKWEIFGHYAPRASTLLHSRTGGKKEYLQHSSHFSVPSRQGFSLTS